MYSRKSSVVIHLSRNHSRRWFPFPRFSIKTCFHHVILMLMWLVQLSCYVAECYLFMVMMFLTCYVLAVVSPWCGSLCWHAFHHGSMVVGWFLIIIVQNPGYMKENFIIVIESLHLADTGMQQNVSHVVSSQSAGFLYIHLPVELCVICTYYDLVPFFYCRCTY